MLRAESGRQEAEHRLRTGHDRMGVQRRRLSSSFRRIRRLPGNLGDPFGCLEQGPGGEAEERRRKEGEEGAGQLEEADQGHADASEDQEQVPQKGEGLGHKPHSKTGILKSNCLSIICAQFLPKFQ